MVSGFRIVARLLTDGAILLGIPQDCERAEKKGHRNYWFLCHIIKKCLLFVTAGVFVPVIMYVSVQFCCLERLASYILCSLQYKLITLMACDWARGGPMGLLVWTLAILIPASGLTNIRGG